MPEHKKSSRSDYSFGKILFSQNLRLADFTRSISEPLSVSYIERPRNLLDHLASGLVIFLSAGRNNNIIRPRNTPDYKHKQ